MNEQIQEEVLKEFSRVFKLKYKRVPAKDDMRTVLAAFIIRKRGTDRLWVVSMATGTKSLPNDLVLQHPQDLLRDMHAEVLAKRAFMRLLKLNLKSKS